MGNQPSRANTPTSSSSSPQSPNVTTSHAQVHHDREQRFHEKHGHNPRRRESIQALSTAKASAAPPSASLESATSSPRAHHRARSQTVSASTSTTVHVTNTLRAAQDTDRMGNEQSRQKGHQHSHSHSHSHPQPLPQPAALTPPKPPSSSTSPTNNAPSAPLRPLPSPQTRPVDVPAAPREDISVTRTEAAAGSLEPADASLGLVDLEGPIVPSSHYSRPPRMPLPIEEETHTPGSPIIYSADSRGPIIDQSEVDSAFPRRGSMLSTTTADDDDLGDEYKVPQGQETVPTLIEWEGPGDNVYVTGTFAGWNRKYRLHRNGPSKNKNALSAYVHITPGTHHLMFIVDNDMKTSDKLPTAVDYTNILVNYIEVVRNEPEEPSAAAPAKKPAPAAAEGQPGYLPSQTPPPPPDVQHPLKKPLPEPKPKVPPPSPKKYHSTIPRYLLDLDAPEESKRFRRANEVQGVMPNPPTLPMFLNKSILNGVTPMKDDSSVLIMPNHTVLNHLATSSIKDNILATSATTRYKQKFLTTIMYKPRAEENESL